MLFIEGSAYVGYGNAKFRPPKTPMFRSMDRQNRGQQAIRGINQEPNDPEASLEVDKFQQAFTRGAGTGIAALSIRIKIRQPPTKLWLATGETFANHAHLNVQRQPVIGGSASFCRLLWVGNWQISPRSSTGLDGISVVEAG